jgi:hypothetical protein
MLTRSARVLVPALATAFTAPAWAVIVPFTEDFVNGVASWRDTTGTNLLTWQPAGGSDGGAFATGSFNFVNQAAGATPVVFRGNSDASGGAFVGNWISAGVTQAGYVVRHDAGVPLTFFARFANPNNFPGATAIVFAPVPSGVWTPLTFAIDPASPQFISFETTDFNTVFSSIGRLQFGVSVPASLAGVDRAVSFDLDNVSIVPAPGALALLAFAGLAAGRRRR